MHYSRPQLNKAQCTLNEQVQSTGIGLQYGEEVSLTLTPAPPNSGTHFLRRDVDITRALIPASWQSIVETGPDTLIGNEYGIGVQGIEAVLAALRGCGIDNVVIETDGFELPCFDGSSAPLLQMINRAGVIAQGACRQIIWIDRFISVRIGEHYACIQPGLLPSITVDDAIAGDSPLAQGLSFSLLEHVFEHEIAPARNPQYAAMAHDRDTQSSDPAATQTPRFTNELTRYRVLESLGLLALAQMPIYGQIYFYKPRAFLVDALMQELFAQRDSWRQLSYLEIEQMTGKLLPGRYQQIPDQRTPPTGTPKLRFPPDPLLQ